MVRVAYSQWFMVYAYLQIDSPYQIYWHQTKYQPYEIPPASSHVGQRCAHPKSPLKLKCNVASCVMNENKWKNHGLRSVCAFKLTSVVVYHLGITNMQDAWQEPFKILNTLFQINTPMLSVLRLQVWRDTVWVPVMRTHKTNTPSFPRPHAQDPGQYQQLFLGSLGCTGCSDKPSIWIHHIHQQPVWIPYAESMISVLAPVEHPPAASTRAPACHRSAHPPKLLVTGPCEPQGPGRSQQNWWLLLGCWEIDLEKPCFNHQLKGVPIPINQFVRDYLPHVFLHTGDGSLLRNKIPGWDKGGTRCCRLTKPISRASSVGGLGSWKAEGWSEGSLGAIVWMRMNAEAFLFLSN